MATKQQILKATVVVPRVKRAEAILIVTRKAKVWNLPEHSRIIIYSGQEARGAHLSPKTRGGKLILSHLSWKDRRRSQGSTFQKRPTWS